MSITLGRADRLERGDEFHFNHPASPNARTWRLDFEPTGERKGTAKTVDDDFPLNVDVDPADPVYTTEG